MRSTKSWLAIGAVVVSVTLPSYGWAKSSLELRLERLENIIDNQVNTNLLTQLDAVQQELQELRGKLEVQQNEFQLLSQRQEKLYVNLDNRLGGLTKTETTTAVTTPKTPLVPVTPVTTDIIEHLSEQTTSPEKTAYDNAYQLMNLKKYPDAITAFRNLLTQYPEGTFVPNVYYWLGEIYLAQWQLNRADSILIDQAKDSFAVVLDKYKGHHKAADALLKLGLVEMDQEHWLAARDLLAEVIQKHPDSSRAKLAESKIQAMQREGRI